MSGIRVRALCREDAGAARAFVSRELDGTRYEARMLELLERACSANDAENRGLVAEDERDATRAVALYGAIAGTRGAARLQAMIGSDPEALDALAEAVVRALVPSEARLVVCELPEEPLFVAAREALRAASFVEEGRLPDLVRDGVALQLLVRRG